MILFLLAYLGGCSTSRSVTGCCSANGRATEVKIDNTELLIMKESDIMGVVIEAWPRKR
jgi:hypothetical protein